MRVKTSIALAFKVSNTTQRAWVLTAPGSIRFHNFPSGYQKILELLRPWWWKFVCQHQKWYSQKTDDHTFEVNLRMKWFELGLGELRNWFLQRTNIRSAILQIFGNLHSEEGAWIIKKEVNHPLWFFHGSLGFSRYWQPIRKGSKAGDQFPDCNNGLSVQFFSAIHLSSSWPGNGTPKGFRVKSL